MKKLFRLLLMVIIPLTLASCDEDEPIVEVPQPEPCEVMDYVPKIEIVSSNPSGTIGQLVEFNYANEDSITGDITAFFDSTRIDTNDVEITFTIDDLDEDGKLLVEDLEGNRLFNTSITASYTACGENFIDQDILIGMGE